MTYNAGWYPDTSHAGMDRYYDGQAWTSHWQPSATAAPGAVVPTYAAPVPAYTEANTRTVAVSTSRGPNTAVIVIAGLNAVWFALRISPVMGTWDPHGDTSRSAKFVAYLSLGCWFGVLLLGRLIPYVGTGAG